MSWKKDVLTACAEKARELGLHALCQDEQAINGYRSLIVCPDGSKEGWADSEAGDAARAALKAWMAMQRHEDSSSPLEWVEVAYGSDDRAATIEDHEWQTPNGLMSRPATKD